MVRAAVSRRKECRFYWSREASTLVFVRESASHHSAIRLSVVSVGREAYPAAKEDYADPEQYGQSARSTGCFWGRKLIVPARDSTVDSQVKHQHVDAGQDYQCKFAAE